MRKIDLVTNLETSRNSFLEVLDTISLTTAQTETVTGQWTVKDILAHLSRWEAEAIRVIYQMNTDKRINHLQLTDKVNKDDQNRIWYLESKNRSWQRILEDFHSVRIQTLNRVEDLPESALEAIITGHHSSNILFSSWISELTWIHEQEHLKGIKSWLDCCEGIS